MLFSPGDSAIHRLNPLTKLMAVVAVLIAGFGLSGNPWIGAGLCCAIAVTALVARVGGRLWAASWRLLLPLVIALAVVQGLFSLVGTQVLFHAGPIQVTREGLLLGLAIALRLIVLVTACLLFLLTTHPGRLFTALSAAGMPPKLTYVISTTLQILPAMRERASAILRAQRARGLQTKVPWYRWHRVFLPLVSPLILSMLSDVDERASALEGRGFGSARRRTSLIDVPDSASQRAARWALPAIAVAAVAWQFAGSGR